MQKRLILHSLTACMITCSASLALATPMHWIDTNGNSHWYQLIDAPYATWSEANLAANALNYNGLTGHLATITSQEENAFIFGSLAVFDRPIWFGGYQAPDAAAANENWRWVTGETWEYTNWANDEPNDDTWGNEDALSFAFFNADGTWNDAPMEWWYYDTGGYVVEYDSVPVPEPATVLLLGTGLAGLGFAGKRKQKHSSPR